MSYINKSWTVRVWAIVIGFCALCIIAMAWH